MKLFLKGYKFQRDDTMLRRKDVLINGYSLQIYLDYEGENDYLMDHFFETVAKENQSQNLFVFKKK